MFIDLLDILRCPRPHEDTWLVGTFDEIVERDVVRGTLGCPACRAEYPVRGGVVYFDDATPAGSPEQSAGAVDEDAVLRLGAMLGLLGAGGVVVLGGAWRRLAPGLVGLVDQLQVLLIGMPHGVPLGPGISAVVVGDALPLAGGSCRGVALDASTATPGRLDGAARVLRPRGRLVAPIGAARPAGTRELARDERVWVAEREPAPVAGAPIGLARARRSGG